MRWLLVADGGGHLALLTWLAPLWAGDEHLYVTVDRPDTRSRLAGRPVVYGSGPTPRSLRALVANARHARRVLSRVAFDRVVTTGAALSVPFVAEAARRGIPSLFLEVADRIERPSLSGRLLAPWATTVAVQHERQRALYRGAHVVGEVRPPRDALAVAARQQPPVDVYVSVGTHGAPMDRLVALAETLAARGYRVLVQHGASRPAHGCDNVEVMVPPEHLAAVARARWVVLHGGTSSVAEAMALGRYPLVVPRDPRFGEHVDDHQLRYARATGLQRSVGEVLRWVEEERDEPTPPRATGAPLQALRQLLSSPAWGGAPST